MYHDFKGTHEKGTKKGLPKKDKAKDKASKVMTVIKQMEDKEESIYQEYEGIKPRWKEY